jgi:hypothetical protein
LDVKPPKQAIRFSQIIQEKGKPEIVTLWGRPDKKFLEAVRQKRVMTVTLQTSGQKAEFGLVGFHKRKNVSYLVFPKPLDDIEDRRVVGIKFDLIEEEGARGKSMPTARGKSTRKPPQRLSPEQVFRVTVRFVATRVNTYEVKAKNKSVAEIRAKEIVAGEEVDFSTATVKSALVKIVPRSS